MSDNYRSSPFKASPFSRPLDVNASKETPKPVEKVAKPIPTAVPKSSPFSSKVPSFKEGGVLGTGTSTQAPSSNPVTSPSPVSSPAPTAFTSQASTSTSGPNIAKAPCSNISFGSPSAGIAGGASASSAPKSIGSAAARSATFGGNSGLSPAKKSAGGDGITSLRSGDEDDGPSGGGISTDAGFKFTPMFAPVGTTQEVNPFAPRVEKSEAQIREEEEKARIAREKSFVENQEKSKFNSFMDKLNRPIF